MLTRFDIVCRPCEPRATLTLAFGASTRGMTRLPPSVPAIFIVVFLAVQVGYPVLAWFPLGLERFSWHMYAGRTEHPRFVIVHGDGTTHTFGPLLRRNSPIKVLGPSVDQARFVPPYLCRRWPDAREVRVRYQRAGTEEVVPCQSVTR